MLTETDAANLIALINRTPINGQEAELVVGLKMKLTKIGKRDEEIIDQAIKAEAKS